MRENAALTRLLVLGAACACAKAWAKRRLPCITSLLVVSTAVEILTTALLVYALIIINTGGTERLFMPVSNPSSATTARN